MALALGSLVKSCKLLPRVVWTMAVPIATFPSAATIPPTEPQTLIPFGASWIYYDGEVSQGIAWRQLEFDDSSWKTGPAPLGYGEGNEATLIDLDENRPTTFYFRYQLVIPDPAQISTMTLRLRRDDGAVVYVNGSEVFRNNMPAGLVDFLTTAASAIEGDAETNLVQWGLWPGYFTTGPNQIAVEVHQAFDGWNDAAFDLQLIANIPLTPPEVAIVEPIDGSLRPPGNIHIVPSYFDADGHLYRMDYFAGTNRIGETTQEPFDFLWANVPPGRYTLKALAIDHSGRRSYSQPVHIQVGNVSGTRIVRGPYLQSGTPTSMTVCWRTDWFADSRVCYGTVPDQLDQWVEDSRPGVDHALVLENLQPNRLYYYSVGTSAEHLAFGPDYYFLTSPTNTQPVRIWVVGDCGTADANAQAVRNAFWTHNYGWHADLWLMLGDNAYEEGTDEEYQKAVFDMYPEMLRNTVLWPTIGNHELGLGNNESFAYLDIFSLPQSGQAGGLPSGTERYYSFDYANLHLICLDSQTSDRFPGGSMQAWLEEDLAATAQDWILAFWHHPPYSKGTHNSDTETQLIQMREQILPILERHGVDLILTGHSHVYERSFLLNGHYGFSTNLTPAMIVDSGSGRSAESMAYRKPAGGLGAGQGAVYVVCGNSGQPGGFFAGFHPAMFFSHAGLGSVVLDVDGLRLEASYLTSQGLIEDSFAIIKGLPSPDVRPPLSIQPGPDPDQITLSWPTSPAAFLPEFTEAGGPMRCWLDITNAPHQEGRQNVLYLNPASQARWYRLKGLGTE